MSAFCSFHSSETVQEVSCNHLNLLKQKKGKEKKRKEKKVCIYHSLLKRKEKVSTMYKPGRILADPSPITKTKKVLMFAASRSINTLLVRPLHVQYRQQLVRLLDPTISSTTLPSTSSYSPEFVARKTGPAAAACRRPTP